MLVHVFKHSAVYEEKIVSFFFALSIHNNFAHFIYVDTGISYILYDT